MNAQCGGLLEIKPRGKEFHVEFIHRTARDLLLTRDMGDYLTAKSGQGFMVNLSTLKGFVFLYRCWVQSLCNPTRSEAEPFWRDGLAYANMAVYESKVTAMEHLDTIETLHATIRSAENNPEWCSTSFRLEVVEAGIDRYVAAKLSECPTYFDDATDMALYRAIHPVQFRDGGWYFKPWTQGHVDIIVMLLQSGHNPNEGNACSSWLEFLSRACHPEGEDFKKSIENSLFHHFLKQGARRDTRLQISYRGIDPSVRRGDASENWLACTHFVMAIFRINFSHRFARHCLETVDSFLDGTAAETRLQLEDLRDQMPQILNDLRTMTSDPVRAKFHAQVMQDIIVRSIQAGVSVASLTPTVATFFPKSQGAALIDLIQRKEESPFFPRAKHSSKHQREEEETAVVSICKKVKM